MANYKVNFLNVEDTNRYSSDNVDWYGRTSKFVGLGIYSKKSASLLADMIRFKWNYTRSGRKGRIIGGGMIVGTNGDVAINCYGEVGILFPKYNNISSYIRIACGPAEKLKSIKDKLANDLKNYWKYRETENSSKSVNSIYINSLIHNLSDEDSKNDQQKVFTINYDEYRTLYEVLKSRNVEKIKGKYGTKNYDEMIGKKMEDQFAIMAIETVQNEISKLIKERDQEKSILEENHRNEERELRTKHQKERDESWNNYQTKIGALESQILRMMSTPQFTL